MLEFKPRISGVKSNRSANCAKTMALSFNNPLYFTLLVKLQIFIFCRFKTVLTSVEATLKNRNKQINLNVDLVYLI